MIHHFLAMENYLFSDEQTIIVNEKNVLKKDAHSDEVGSVMMV